MISSILPQELTPIPGTPVGRLVAFEKATDAQVAAFCDAILLGIPTSKILPAGISDLRASGGITADQLALIKAARKNHEEHAEADRKVLFRLARSRRVRGARFNAAGILIGLRFGARVKAAK